MKAIVEIADDVALDLIEDLLENGLACHVHAENYVEPNVPKALLYDPPENVHRTWQTLETGDQNDDTLLKQNMMLYVGGSDKAFRCGCGANVFSLWQEPDGRQYYECHGCWTVYRGEKA